MYLLVIFLSLIGSLLSGFFGRFLGKNGAAFITTLFVCISALISYFIFYEIVLLNSNCTIKLFN